MGKKLKTLQETLTEQFRLDLKEFFESQFEYCDEINVLAELRLKERNCDPKNKKELFEEIDKIKKELFNSIFSSGNLAE